MSSRSSGTYRLDEVVVEGAAASRSATEPRGRGGNGAEGTSYEEVDVEIFNNGMWQSAAKTMWQSSEKTRTWGVFSGTPPACDDGARRPEPLVRDVPEASEGTRGVALLATVRVGVAGKAPLLAKEPAAQPPAAASSPSVGEGQPNGKPRAATQRIVPADRPVHKAAPTIRANNPTRIFEVPVSPALLAARPTPKANEPSRILTAPPAPSAGDAKASGEASRATLGTASFSPVRSPVRGSNDHRHSLARPSSEANESAQSFIAPKLRAFDDGQPRRAAWSEAETLCQPVFQAPPVFHTEQEEPAANGPIGSVKRSEPWSWRLPSPERLLAELRQSSTRKKGMVALVIAATTILGASMLATWRIARVALDESAVSAAPALRPGVAHAESRASVAPAAAPQWVLASSSPLLAEAASPPLAEATPPDPAKLLPPASKAVDGKPAHDKPVHDKPSPVSAARASHEVTPARRAVDALLAGDRANALRHYQELSRAAPDRKVYREAVRLLSRSASSTPN